jgi:hypothetical protein
LSNRALAAKLFGVEWSNENLVAKLASILQESRKARGQLSARLRELEAEADSIRAELAELDIVVSQSEASLYRRLSSVLASTNVALDLPSDVELESAMYRNSVPPPRYQSPVEPRRSPIPQVRSHVEAVSDRFIDRTIPQAVTLLLREEGAPLHVNEIFNRLKEGGFRFNGQNPTISIAVSLNRNGRFRKIAPGTFDLVMRDASKAS